MKTIQSYISLSIILLFATACTKVVDIKVGNDTGRLDIEANVTNTSLPQVIRLSKNVPFTDTNTYPAVTGATVSVTDQSGQVYPFVEGPTGTYTSNSLTGVAGNTYKMTVLTNGNTYNASSVMPAQVMLDTLTSQNTPTPGSDNKKEISVHYHDPIGVDNHYRFVLWVNGVQERVVFAADDQFNDGKDVSVILRQDDVDIHAGDKAVVEMQCLDQPIYLYWFTLSQQSADGPGGSVTPSDPPTNISPVSLGYFSAHTTQTKSIIVK
ncbi:DUF4249 domain-containing protein [Pedobacter sp. L105]|uniref:DUF4249 domain-containing protein n=1 Tax=Pedobacter sp. L105 TaxID=1641871 RepID=UPI00131D15E7|nr:DUF4249 domain-containing protein [Pedobacter sp. L105]